MFIFLLLMTLAVPVTWSAPELSHKQVSCISSAVTAEECISFGCEPGISNTCVLKAGTVRVERLLGSQHPQSSTKLLRLIAALDSQFTASGSFDEFQNINISLIQGGVRMHILSQASKDVVLDNVRIFGLSKTLPRPRVMRLNGKLMHRGDLHYHRNLQMLELLDLALPMTDNFYIDLLSSDQEAEEIECPVSYSDREADFSITETLCANYSPSCVWNNGCWLTSPLQYGYLVDGPSEVTEFGYRVPLRMFGNSIFGASIQNIALEVFIYSESLVRLKIYDPTVARYEVPIALNLPSTPFTGETQYDVIVPSIEGSPFYVQVVRRDTGTVIFDTSLVGLTFEDQLLSVALRLPSRNLYGLGESYHPTFRRELDDSTWPLWARDEPPSPFSKANLYGVHPFYEVVENDGNAHGVLLYNSNAMEYQLQSAAPAVVYRTIGGILDFYLVSGPTPEDVVKQYTNIVGRSFLPPYWSLGFQLSRYGYNNLGNMEAAIERTKSCGIPFDVFYGDIDTMDNQGDFTIDQNNFAGLSAFVDDQRSQGLRYVPILDPAIPSQRDNYATYDRGLQADAYIRASDGNVLLGNVWPPEPVAFPDFFRSGTYSWWEDEIRRFYEVIKFDGLWIDMNEPANFNTNMEDPEGDYTLFCPVTKWDDPPYNPKAGKLGPTNRLSDKTICLDSAQGDGNIYRHYDVHSLYGYSETIPTSAALQQVTGKRGLVFTRSSFVGSGILGGHWTGDNYAFWDHLQYSVIGMLDFNLFGLPYVGADICGYFADSEERLCERWQEVGAFYPFSRNHNTIFTADQDPCIWPDTVGASTRKAMLVRYHLLPYFYTTFYRANQGLEGTVIRALLHQYPEDRETYGIDRQFLWGDAVLVSPALDQGSVTTPAYFPAGRWYDYYTGKPLDSLAQYVILDVPYDFIPVHLRGGRIIPVQKPEVTTTASRQNPLGLIVALDDNSSAKGDLFWDDGESIDTVKAGDYHYSTFSFENNELTQTVENAFNTEMQDRFIEDVEFLGVTSEPAGVEGDVGPDVVLAYDAENQKATLSSAHISIVSNFSVRLTF